MDNSVMIKGNQSGIIVVLDANLDFEELKSNIAEKFKASAKFLGNANVAVTFEGRELTTENEREILDIIAENSDLNVICVVDLDAEKEKIFKQCLNDKLMELSNNTGQFYKGNLRSGQVLEFETSIIIIGDVNAGAKVVSKGNVIILGALKGNVFAGASGNQNSFVVALSMDPVQIRIGDIIARAPDDKAKDVSKEAKIAYVEDGNIYIESISKDVLNDISL